MSDPICGPVSLIHSFGDEELDKVNDENSVYFKNFEKRRRKRKKIFGKAKYRVLF